MVFFPGLCSPHLCRCKKKNMDTYLVRLVSQRRRSPFLRTPQHQSAAIVVRVAVHHGGGRHWVPEVRGAAQLGATAATRRCSRLKWGSHRGAESVRAREASITHPSSRELVLLRPCSDSALIVSIWMRSCSCGEGGKHSCTETHSQTALEENRVIGGQTGRKPSHGETPRSAS